MDYARVLKIPQYFRNLQRLSEIVTVLIKHGLGDLVSRLHLASYLETGMRLVHLSSLSEREPPPDFPKRLRLVCEELGPVFIKFGQIVASRPDSFPDSITREFRNLHDNVAPFPFSQARQVIESELGSTLESVYRSFDQTPIAAASIAQVHRAVLQSGEEVVVKVRRPQLDRIIETDVDILRGLAALIEEHIPESQRFSPSKLIEEFARTLRAECDFRREAQNLTKFAENFSDDDGLIIPKVHGTFSGRSILTEAFIPGIRADNVEALQAAEVDCTQVADILNRVVLRSIFEHRFFHADPHAGNVLVTHQGKVAFVDFGAMGRLDKSRLFQVLQFLSAILTQDLDRMLRVLQEYQFAPMVIDEVALKTQVSEIVDQFLHAPLGALDMAELVSSIFEVVRRYGMTPPADLLLVGKSLTTLEYLGAKLDPGFEPLKKIQPYILRQYTSQISDPRLYARYAAEVVDAYRKLVIDFPRELRTIMRKLSREELVLTTTSRDFQALVQHQNRMLNRALMTATGIALLALGVVLNIYHDISASHLSISYLLMIWGAVILVSTWLSIKKTGGSS